MIIHTQRKRKRVSLSILGIIFCLFFLTIGQLFPIEISNPWVKLVIYTIIIFALPIFAVRQLRGWFKTIRNQNFVIGIKVLFVFLLIPYFFFPLIFAFGNLMCGNLTDQILFKKEGTFPSQIVIRHFDCGAVDNGNSNFHLVKVVDLFSVFNIVTKVDTTEIDKSKWLKVN